MATRKWKSTRIPSNQLPHECLFCSKIYQGYNALQLHMNQHTGEHPYQCSECPANFTDYRHLGHHKDKVHYGKQFVCEGCHLEYSSQSTLSRHRNGGSCTGTKKILQSIKVKRMVSGGKIKVVCKQPGKFIRKSGKIKAVVRNSGEVIRTSEGAQVNQKMSSKTNLPTSKSGKIYKAEESIGTSSEQKKVKHERKFGKEKQVNGNPSVTIKSQLNTEDVDLKPIMSKSAVYKCSQFPTTHLDRNLLLKHAAYCHGRKTFECPICKNLYTQHQNMTRHLTISHGNRNGGDASSELLKLHERRTKCILCNLTFQTYSLLVEHKKMKHHFKLFKCSYCRNEYTQYSNMARHRKSHDQLISLPRVYTRTNEKITAENKQKGCATTTTTTATIPTKVEEQQVDKLEQFPVYVNRASKGSSENCLEDGAYQQLLEMVNKLRIQKKQNFDKNASFFLHLNRYDPSSI